MKIIIKLVKRVILCAFFLYGYNLIAVNFNMIIPINIYTLGLVSILGIPSILGLVLFKVFILWGVIYGINYSKEKILWINR